MKLGINTGSLINHLYSKNMTVPEVGKGATLLRWTDREAYEVLEVSPDLKKVIIQRYKTKRIDNNGMGDVQEYEYCELEGCKIEVVWKWNSWREKYVFQYYNENKELVYKIEYPKINIIWGKREHYHDYSF